MIALVCSVGHVWKSSNMKDGVNILAEVQSGGTFRILIQIEYRVPSSHYICT